MIKKGEIMKQPKFIVQVHHSSMRTFSTDVEFGKQPISLYSSFDRRQKYNNAYQDHGQIVAEMVRGLLQIVEVDNIFVSPYQVSVSMKNSQTHFIHHQWDERIDQIVKKAFRAEYAKLHHQRLTITIITNHPNNLIRSIHTNFEISNSSCQMFQRPLQLSSVRNLQQVGNDGEELVRKLMEIPGVTDVSIQPYQVSVTIGKAFSWIELDDSDKSISDKIVDTFKTVFGNSIIVSYK